MPGMNERERSTARSISAAPIVEVVIEIPRGSFRKIGSSGRVDFISPLPCPFNYGSVPDLVGLEGDLLDALVLGPRLPAGTRIKVHAFGAVGLSDRGLYDDKLVCADAPPGPWTRRGVLAFFHLYARCKRLLNLWRRRPGLTRCEGWGDAVGAIARARPRDAGWRGPEVPF
jgi:inorganic pyrophosphatase